MTELDAALVRRKLATIVRNLELLEAVEGLSLEEYQRDPFRRKGVERMLQEAIDAAVDANLHLLRAAGAPAAADYYDSFIAVGRTEVIPETLAKRLAPAAGLRNRLVHEYDEIDDEKVLEAVRAARTDLGDYVAAVEAHLEAAGF